jgi:L-ribulokinase
MDKKFCIGLDFGTNSCRSLIVDITNGRELASHVFHYPSGEAGIILDEKDPSLARQNPADYLTAVEVTITRALAAAKGSDADFSSQDIIGIGVDTTGSSPLPVDEGGSPLCLQEPFRDNPHALVWLWKDHTSFAEAEEITQLAADKRPHYLAKVGGVYSSEWFWSKILHCLRQAPDVFAAAHSFMEICDFIPAHLCGHLESGNISPSICAAGHKALYNARWGGLPDQEFLAILAPELAGLRDRLYHQAFSASQKAGHLSAAWSRRLGLPGEVAVAVGAFDAHLGAVGAGVKPGTLVKILGTSTCDIMVSPNDVEIPDIPGVCGIVDGSVMDGHYGIEAGQSAVGDIFLWFVNQLASERYGESPQEKFNRLEDEAARLNPGESGLLALDWNNGNRTILVDARLSGLILGQTLHTAGHEIYRALIEATAFGALAIIDRIQEYGISITDIINCGGLAVKSPLLMQIYADICGRPMKISGSQQTPALGAAICAAVAAGRERGGYGSIVEAQAAMVRIGDSYEPDAARRAVYRRLYALYKKLHDGFGLANNGDSMFSVMKELLQIRDEVRRGHP